MAGTPPVVVLEVVDGGERPVTTAPPLAEPEAYVLLRTGWSDQIKTCGNPAVEGMEPRYLNIEHGVVDVTPIASDWLSARWGILRVGQDSIGERWALKNQWTGAYLVSVDGQVETGPTPLTGEGVGPGVWTVERGEMPPTQFRLRSADRAVHVGPCPWVIEPVPVAPAPAVVVYTRLAAALDPAARIHAEQGAPAIDRVPDAWYSAVWVIERQPGNLVTFRNRWKEGYLNAEQRPGAGREGFNASGKGTGIWKYFPPQASRGATLTRTPRMVVWTNTATGTNLCLTGSSPVVRARAVHRGVGPGAMAVRGREVTAPTPHQDTWNDFPTGHASRRPAPAALALATGAASAHAQAFVRIENRWRAGWQLHTEWTPSR